MYFSLSFQATPERKPAVVGGVGIDSEEVDSGLHSTVAGSMDMSVDNDDDDDYIPPGRGHHHPAPLKLPKDPSTDIPLDPDLAESHYLDMDDFEADESESEVHTLCSNPSPHRSSCQRFTEPLTEFFSGGW